MALTPAELRSSFTRFVQIREHLEDVLDPDDEGKIRVTKEEAEKIKAKFVAEGATVEIK